MQTGSSETLNAWNLEKTTYCPLWDRMEGAWPWTQKKLAPLSHWAIQLNTDLGGLSRWRYPVNHLHSKYSISFKNISLLYSSCVALFYRKRLPQRNGDRRKRDLHAFQVYVGQGRLLAPPPPPHAIRRRALCTLPAPPPCSHGQKLVIFRKSG